MSYFNQQRKIPFSFRWLILIILFSGSLSLHPENKSFLAKEQTPVHKKDSDINPEMLIGERLFYGLVPFEAGTFNCEGCHYTISSEKLNWSPSAYDLSVWVKDKKDADIKKAFDSPSSQKMEESHLGILLTDPEINKLKAYLAYVNKTGLALHKPFPYRLIIFFAFGLLMAMALIDLIFTRYIKYRIIHVIAILTGLAVHVQMAVTSAQELGRTRHYAPDQPIKFSHKVHAGDNKTDCQYCHSVAALGKSGGIPAANLCTNCHAVVKTGRNSGKFEINKIFQALKTGKAIEWIRIHNLPDHVYFNHSQHVTAGKVACQTCHGPVETMDIMQQYSDLSMGWCINCHRQTRVQTDNPYYSKNKKLLEMVKNKAMKEVTVEATGGLDCMKCHY